MSEVNTLTFDQIMEATKSNSSSDLVRGIYEATPVGSIDSAIGTSLLGVNHRQQPGLVPINKDHYGFTFFTRPNLNLRDENLMSLRKFSPLLSSNPRSLPRWIRCTLDPLLAWRQPSITSAFADDQMPFIPILTNNLISMSGWPDLSVDVYTAPDGIHKETFSIVDSVADHHGAFSLTANFRNLDGDPINFLFFYWLHYMSAVYLNYMAPYPENVIDNTIDYQTRIWRLVMDPTKRFVQKIACCAAAIPLSVPLGNSFNFEFEEHKPYNQANDQISITFHAIGAWYLDPLLVNTFNRTSYLFNGALRPQYRDSHFVKVPYQLLDIFNNYGYPVINENTYELEWWVTKELYGQKAALVQKMLGLRDDNAYKNPSSAYSTTFKPN